MRFMSTYYLLKVHLIHAIRKQTQLSSQLSSQLSQLSEMNELMGPKRLSDFPKIVHFIGARLRLATEHVFHRLNHTARPQSQL